MKEIRSIISAWDQAVKQGKQAALATVVHVEGSSYRRPGARMLITEEGQLTGAISGGCLEGDALRKALLVMTQQKPMLVTYDTMDDDDAKFGVGLGCNGIIQVLIEPINSHQVNHPIHLLQAASDERQQAVLATLFSLDNKKDPQQGTCLLVKAGGQLKELKADIPLKDLILADAANALLNQASLFKNYIAGTIQITAFIELIKPPVSLVIVGAGNDVMPLAEMAGILGWDTTIVDGRSTHARAERFGNACQVLVSRPENVLSQVAIDKQTIFLLMTHNYNYDMAMLVELVKRGVTYIGMLGPRKKLERMIDELGGQGINLNADQLAMIHSPVGLDIGAETPEEIALSILAEVKAVLSKRNGRPLREYPTSIHDGAATVIEEARVPS